MLYFKADQIKKMIDAFCAELDQVCFLFINYLIALITRTIFIYKDSKFVQAIRDYITNEDTSLLSFRKGDVIKLLNKSYTPHGWLRGMLNGRKGVFPVEYVRPIARSELFDFERVSIMLKLKLYLSPIDNVYLLRITIKNLLMQQLMKNPIHQ